jgi:hypothetical protein
MRHFAFPHQSGHDQTGEGFTFSKDLVLKAGLVLIDERDIRFKVTNFLHLLLHPAGTVEWTVHGDLAWCRDRATEIGPACVAVIDALLGDRPLDRLRTVQPCASPPATNVLPTATHGGWG